MANIILDAIKSQGVSSTVVLNEGDTISLSGFELSQAQQVFVNESGQLVIVLTDGTQFLVTNFAQNLAENPNAVMIISEDGTQVSYSDVIAQFITQEPSVEEIEPALGPETTSTTVATNATGEGSNAAENSDLFGAGQGFSNLATSEAVNLTSYADSTLTTTTSSPNLFTTIGPNNNDGSVTGTEDTTFALNIAAPTDVDTSDAALRMVVAGLPDSIEGEIQLNGVAITAGQVLTPTELTNLIFIPAADYNGTTTFTYNIVDETNNVTGSTHSITVTGTPDSPVFSGPSALTIDEDAAATNLDFAIPTDPDTPYGDVLTMSLTTPLSAINGTITLDGVAITDGQTFTTAEFGRLQFAPNADYNGAFTINYQTEDSTGTIVTNTHDVTVNAVNDAPVANDSTSTQLEDSTVVALGIPAPTDVEGDTITITLNSPLPTDGTIYYADGLTPVLSTDTLTVAQLTGLVFTPNADFNGDVAISYTATDGAASDTATHTVTVVSVNDLPVANDSTSSQAEDSTDVALGIPLPTDVDDAVLIARIDTLPTEGVLKFASGTLVTAGVDFDANELAGLTFTPNADYNGSVAINYTVEDDEGGSDNAIHTITVNAVNDAPVTTDTTSSQDEDSIAVDLNIAAPTDVDGDSLDITIDALPTDGTLYYADGTTPVNALDVLTVAELTSLKFTPNANYNGDVIINYTVDDGTTTVGGSHTVTVNSIEDIPEVTNSSSIQDEDSVDITLAIPLPTDGDGDTLYATITTLPTDGTLKFSDGSLVPEGSQFLATELPGITFTPNPDYLGTININYTVTDGKATVPATHTITVNNTPDQPVVTDSSSSQDEDSVAVALNITAPTDPDGDALTIITSLPAEGTLYYADGTTPVGLGDNLTVTQLTGLRFTPNPDFNGTVTINYTVSDGDVATADVNGTHTITVNPVNDAPVVTNSSSTQAEDTIDQALGIPLATDVDTGDVLQFRITSTDNNGTVKLADGTVVVAGTLYDIAEITGLTFTPNANFDGTVALQYEVSDGTVATPGTHTITVTGVNDAPIVDANTSSVQDEDSGATALGITEPTDPENDTLTVTIDALPDVSEGILYYADGTTPVGSSDVLTPAELAGLTFIPAADFNGDVIINYTVDDGALTSGGTHTITVNSINDLPAVTDSSSSQAEDTADVTLNIPVATDADGDALRFTIASLPTDGTLTFADGSAVAENTSYAIADIAGLRFTPNADYNGTVVINYTVSDGVGPAQSASHTITVTPLNDAPVVNDSSSTQNEDEAATLGIPTPTDVDGDTLYATIDTLPTEGTLTFANGSAVQAGVQFDATELSGIVFTPNLNYFGTVTINYTVTDTFAAPESATHTITVNSMPDSILVAAGALDDNVNQVNFDSLLRAAEAEDCVSAGTYKLSAEYQYNTVLAGSSYNYDLPDSTFVATDGSPLTYSGTYTYNGQTYAIPTTGNWVTINPLTGDLSGSFPSSMKGLITFKFTATSPDGVTASKNLTYNVMTQSQYNSIEVEGPRYGNYLLPENTGDHLMVGVNEAGILRLDLLTTGRGVVADLEKGYVDKQNGYVDLIDGFKTVQTTDYADTIIAENGKSSYVYANGGNDTVVSSNAHDYLYGGAGHDTLSYANLSSGVTVNLANSTSSLDTISSFESVIGSNSSDTLIGSAGANYIDGGYGADVIDAGAGNDTVIYDENDISVNGGAGFDKLIVADKYTSTGNIIKLDNVAGFEEISIDNNTYNETLSLNASQLLSSANGNEIRIKGDRVMDMEGARYDDRVMLEDKTAAQIHAAELGSTTIDGTRYDVYDFGSQGTLLVELGLDILDSSGDIV